MYIHVHVRVGAGMKSEAWSSQLFKQTNITHVHVFQSLKVHHIP